MKIIKHGLAYRDENKIFKHKCLFCNCEFEYCDTEVKFMSMYGHAKDFIYCPECQIELEVSNRWKKDIKAISIEQVSN